MAFHQFPGTPRAVDPSMDRSPRQVYGSIAVVEL
jgi:hypothetical protein